MQSDRLTGNTNGSQEIAITQVVTSCWKVACVGGTKTLQLRGGGPASASRKPPSASPASTLLEASGGDFTSRSSAASPASPLSAASPASPAVVARSLRTSGTASSGASAPSVPHVGRGHVHQDVALRVVPRRGARVGHRRRRVRGTLAVGDRGVAHAHEDVASGGRAREKGERPHHDRCVLQPARHSKVPPRPAEPSPIQGVTCTWAAAPSPSSPPRFREESPAARRRRRALPRRRRSLMFEIVARELRLSTSDLEEAGQTLFTHSLSRVDLVPSARIP